MYAKYFALADKPSLIFRLNLYKSLLLVTFGIRYVLICPRT